MFPNKFFRGWGGEGGGEGERAKGEGVAILLTNCTLFESPLKNECYFGRIDVFGSSSWDLPKDLTVHQKWLVNVSAIAF